MDNNGKITIRLHIYDTDINVKVLPSDEAIYRRGATLINQLLNAYFGAYKGYKSDKEINYFAMIDIATQLERELQRNDTQPYDKILLQLTSEIESALKEGSDNTGKSK